MIICVSSRILYVSYQFITDSLGNPKLILLVGGSYLKIETWNCQAGYVTTNPNSPLEEKLLPKSNQLRYNFPYLALPAGKE